MARPGGSPPCAGPLFGGGCGGGKAATPFGSPVAASAFTGASDELTFSGLAAPADSCDPTVEGPAPKRPRAGYGLSGGGLGVGGGGGAWGASAATYDSDDSDGEEAVSRKRPTPQKGAAPLAAAAAAPRPAARMAPLHPPPTWAQSGGGGAPSTQQPRHVHWGPVVQVGAGRAGWQAVGGACS